MNPDIIEISNLEKVIGYYLPLGRRGDQSKGIQSKLRLILIGGKGGCLGGSWDFIIFITIHLI